MTNEEKIKAIKTILGPEYETVAVFAAKQSEDHKGQAFSLVDGNSGAVAAMIMNYLVTDPLATSIVKATIPELKTNQMADLIGKVIFGGKD